MFKPTLVILAGILVTYQPMVFADSEMFRDIEDTDQGMYSSSGAYEYRDRFPREIESVRHLRDCGTGCGYRGYRSYNADEGYTEPGADYLNDHR